MVKNDYSYHNNNEDNYNYHDDDEDNYDSYDDEEFNDYSDMSDGDYMFEVEEVQLNDNSSKGSYSKNDSWDFSLFVDTDYVRDSKNECYDNIRDNECCDDMKDNEFCDDMEDDEFCDDMNDNECYEEDCIWEDDYNCDCHCDCDYNNNKAELLVEKSVDKEEAYQGEVLRYCLVIRNIGTAPACNVIVKDCLDKCLSFVRGSLRSNNRKVNVCRWGDILIKKIQPSECIKITFKVIVRECSSELIENFAMVCYEYAPNDFDDIVNQKVYSNTVSTRIMRVEIDMVKSANKQCVELGENIVYTIDITNRSNATIENFILRDQLNRALRCLEITSRGQRYNCCRLARGINLGQIAPLETVSVYIKARVECIGQGNIIPNIAYGVYTLNGIVSQEIQSNVFNISVTFNQCREVELKDAVRLSCQMGPAIGIVQARGKAVVTRVDRINRCGGNNRIRVVGCVKTEYIYDKGYDCHEKVLSEVPFNLIIKIPSGLNSTENLDIKVCLKNICSKIKCGYTIISDLKLGVYLKSKQ